MKDYPINEALIKEDLYEAVNGAWLEAAEIPADQPATGGFSSVRLELEDLMMTEMGKMAQGSIATSNSEEEEFVKLYHLAHDFQSLDQAGGEPAQAVLQKIQALKSYEDFQDLLVDWTLQDLPLPWSMGLTVDMKDSNHYIWALSTPSTILPDTTYYEEGHPQAQELLAIYQESAQEVLELLGVDQRDQIVQDALAFDRLLVPHLKSREELADYTKSYNLRSAQEVQAYLPDLDLLAVVEELLGQRPDQYVVTQPKYFEALADILQEDHFPLLRHYLLVRTALTLAPYLSEDLRQAGSRYQLALSGNQEAPDRQKHAFRLATGVFDQVVGNYYGKTYFGPEAKADVEAMCQTMIDVYAQRLRANDWLSQETIDLALLKLDKLAVLIGYPETYPAYFSHYQVQEDQSLLANLLTFRRLYNQAEYAKFEEAVDKTEWGMSADTVNAYFNPVKNHICFPAAILQAPFYDLNQSRAANYGGIGAVIAHEISHAFDTNGAKFDHEGNLHNWWREEDYQAFEVLADRMIDQWEGIDFAGGQVNGQLTLTENIADGGGLTAALLALEREDQPDFKEFFYNWVRIWAMKARPEYQALLLQIDVHSPAKLRANLAPQNLAAFHQVFDLGPGDAMYMAPEDRVIIW